VEGLPWRGAVTRWLFVGEKKLLVDECNTIGVGGAKFFRFRFPGQDDSLALQEFRLKEGPARIIVSHSGKDFVVHRVNKGSGNVFQQNGLIELWGAVKQHLLQSNPGARLWMGVPPKHFGKGTLLFFLAEYNLRWGRPTRAVIEAHKMKQDKFARSIKAMAKSAGFSKRGLRDPKPPKQLALVEPGNTPFLYRAGTRHLRM